MTRIMRCGCTSVYQDEVYGRGKRVHNDCTGRAEEYRCTVCGSQKSAAAGRSHTPKPTGKKSKMGAKKSGKKGKKQK